MHPPVRAVVPAAAGAGGTLPAELSFLRASAPRMVITAVKRAEDDDDLIVRFYESRGEPGEVKLFSSLPIQSVKRANFIEDVLDATGETVAAKGLELSSQVRGFEIRTWKLKLAPIPDVNMTGTRGGGPKRDF
jgi:alpha-mannosidase